jgi:hypothetical protein
VALSPRAADLLETEDDVDVPIPAHLDPGGVRGVSLGRVEVGIERFAARRVEFDLLGVGGPPADAWTATARRCDPVHAAAVARLR